MAFYFHEGEKPKEIRVGNRLSGLGWSGVAKSIEYKFGSVIIELEKQDSEKNSRCEDSSNQVAVAEYPRVMMVSDNEVIWINRLVIASNKSGCVAYNIAEDIDEVHDESEFVRWKFAKEIEPEIEKPMLELTMDELLEIAAEKNNTTADRVCVVMKK